MCNHDDESSIPVNYSSSSRLRLRSVECSVRSMRGGFIFRNRRPLLKVHHGQCLYCNSDGRVACNPARSNIVSSLVTVTTVTVTAIPGWICSGLIRACTHVKRSLHRTEMQCRIDIFHYGSNCPSRALTKLLSSCVVVAVPAELLVTALTF